MKMSRRIFVVLLTVALLVSCFAFSASAEEVTLENYEGILEYYVEPVIFGLDFSSGGVDYADELMIANTSYVTHSIVDDASAPGGKYLDITFKSGRPTNKGNLYLNWNAESSVDSFYVDFTVNGGVNGSSGYLPKLGVIIGEESFNTVTNGSAADTSIINIDFAAGKVYYLIGIDANGAQKTQSLDYTVSQDTWYNVSLTYNSGYGYEFTVTNANDSSDTATMLVEYTPYDSVKNVRLGVHGANLNSGNIIRLASLSAAGGSFRRNTADRQAGIESDILELYDLYKSSDVAISDKIGLCNVANKIVSYGFTTDNAEVNAAFEDMRLGSVTLYADEITKCLEQYSAIETYAEKRALVDANMEYATVLSDMDLSPVGDEKAARIKDDLKVFFAHNDALVDAEYNSVSFIAALEGVDEVIDGDDYSKLSPYYYEAVVYKCDLTYEGVASAYEKFLILEEKVSDIENRAEAFISLVTVANDETVNFAVRYNAYVDAGKDIYDNETYPGISEALALYNEVLDPYMTREAEVAESFIKNVNSADFAPYITAKQEYLRQADIALGLCHPDFEGVAEAKLLYLEVQKYIEEQLSAAKAYVDAVNALDSLTGDALMEGIKLAQSLQNAGNVLGAEGVTEANIKLDQIVSSIELADRYSNYFINAVNAIADATNASERYSLIAEAKSAEKMADPAYAGVSEASAELKTIVENYNKEVAAANAAFETASEVGAKTAGVGKTANAVSGHVIALVKKFFDLDD